MSALCMPEDVYRASQLIWRCVGKEDVHDSVSATIMPSPSGGGGLRRGLAVLALLATHVALAAPESDWTDCPTSCRCKWVHGRKMAECSQAGYSAVPDLLSPEIQWLDLNDNNFPHLPKEAFKQVGLVNLQKVYLKNCGIQSLDKDAFYGLVLLIEVDLSDNTITKLHPSTFKENFRLRILYLNRNPLEKLENDLFTNHTFLQTVELSDCKIKHLGPKTFSNVPVLQQLNLDGNNLEFIRLSTVSSLTKLKSLVLSRNPWKCDCKLRPLRDWVVEKKLYAQPTTCAEPVRLQDKFWNDVKSEEFACKPQLALPSSSVAAYPGGNVTLSCRAAGDPTPELRWVFNSLVLENNTRPAYAGHRQHYTIHRGEARNQLGEYWTWMNLTIIDVKHYDGGKYACGAKNPGGVAEEILTLGVREGRGGFIINGVLLLCFFLCRKKGRRSNGAHRNNSVIKKHETQLSCNGDINLNGDEDQEKALIVTSKYNPLPKPARRLESTQSSLNGSQGADLSNLAAPRPRGSEGTGDHCQSDDLLLGRSYDSLDSDAPATQLSHHQQQQLPLLPQSGTRSQAGTLPSNHKLSPHGRPDLLPPFPPRAGQDSPAGSSTSTAPDSSRLPSQHLGSPISHLPHSNSGFGTLPHNRSQSPFTYPSMMGSCGSLPIVTSRQGYVTIPRRPRAPSWAAPPRPGDPLLKAEPIYDNLGPRTTADGSSILSLNKTGDGTLPRTPNRTHVRPLPSTPTSPLPMYYDPIEEVPSPAPIRHNKNPPKPRTSPTKKIVVIPTKKMLEAPPIRSSPIPTSQDGGRKTPVKIPPKVPPKPKKKPINGENGGLEKGAATLYEDDGEDGTEV
ncbi:hypothetical protein B566_EDAN002619 [Ephemera danica]|nr:hypothetical protein B566_EDAN002619 [Ephemera danica]